MRVAVFCALLLAFLLLQAPGHAQVPVPALKARVTDLTDTFGITERGALESQLAAFERETGSQVAVLLVPTTQPESIEQFSIRVVDAWKLGRAEQDDGVLLLVAKDDRALRIEVGRGLEGAIPDAVAKRIIEEFIVPRFRDGDFSGGVQAGVDRILGLIRGEYLPPPSSSDADDPLEAGFPLIFALMLAGQVLRHLMGALPGAALVGGGAFALGLVFSGSLGIALFFGVVAFVFTFAGISTGLSGGGSGGGGYRSSGGFGGGGGGFGGGGASGRW